MGEPGRGTGGTGTDETFPGGTGGDGGDAGGRRSDGGVCRVCGAQPVHEAFGKSTERDFNASYDDRAFFLVQSRNLNTKGPGQRLPAQCLPFTFTTKQKSFPPPSQRVTFSASTRRCACGYPVVGCDPRLGSATIESVAPPERPFHPRSGQGSEKGAKKNGKIAADPNRPQRRGAQRRGAQRRFVPPYCGKIVRVTTSHACDLAANTTTFPESRTELQSPDNGSVEATIPQNRSALVRRGRQLEYFGIGYNSLEGLFSIVAGAIAGSVSLIGFGLDSLIEVTSGAALLWRLHHDRDHRRREQVERTSLRIVGGCFLALALYILYESGSTLIGHAIPERSIPGILVAAVSVVVMPLLARAKRRIAAGIGSGAMQADSRQTDFCTYLSAVLLGGLLLNAIAGWWWADPVTGLGMVPIIGKEGLDGLRGKTCCDECGCH